MVFLLVCDGFRSKWRTGVAQHAQTRNHRNCLGPEILWCINNCKKKKGTLCECMAKPCMRVIFWKNYCKVTNFRPVPIFVLLTWNWFVRTNFRTFEVLKNKITLKFEGLKTKVIFHTILNFALFSKVRKYEIKYRTKICDFTVTQMQVQEDILTCRRPSVKDGFYLCVNEGKEMQHKAGPATGPQNCSAKRELQENFIFITFRWGKIIETIHIIFWSQFLIFACAQNRLKLPGENLLSSLAGTFQMQWVLDLNMNCSSSIAHGCSNELLECKLK